MYHFLQKTTMLFRPDQSSIGRLVNRKKNGKNTAKVSVGSDTAKIGMTFSTKTKKWDAEITTEENGKSKCLIHKCVYSSKRNFIQCMEFRCSSEDGKCRIWWHLFIIIAAAKIDISRGVDSAARKKYLKILQQISSGKVTLHEDRFYLKPGTQAKLEFNLVAWFT